MRYFALMLAVCGLTLGACTDTKPADGAQKAPASKSTAAKKKAPESLYAKTKSSTPKPEASDRGTCVGPYPNYWQDPAFTKVGMWADQKVTNTPASQGGDHPVFRLSQAFPVAAVDDTAARGWLKYEPWKAGLTQAQMTEQANKYAWAVMDYIMAGNVEHGAKGGDVSKDWTICNNPVRPWFHMPWQTYEALAGREFMHGLTREAPVTFSVDNGKASKDSTMWAVGFYNASGASAIGSVWQKDGTPKIPANTGDFTFPEGSVVGKLLFNTLTPAELPFLANAPVWTINMSEATYCHCKTPEGKDCTTLAEQSVGCPRAPGKVHLMQFDIAVRDGRSPQGWVFGTFVADGQHKAGEKNPWRRISPLGLMWGNDTPPKGTGAAAYPVDPKTNGFKEEVIFWDVANRINGPTNAGHLGCNSRLNGPADNARSSCMSCHMTASVRDLDNAVPPLLAYNNFTGGSTGECVPGAPDLAADDTYFQNIKCGDAFDGAAVKSVPNYKSGDKTWIALDYSLQLSMSLQQHTHWLQHEAQKAPGAQRGMPTVRRR